MLPLISHILLCLVAAAVVGFLVGWFLRVGQVAQLTAEKERLRATMPTGVLPSALSTRLELLARLMEEVKARPATEPAALERRLEALAERLDGLIAAVDALREQPPPRPLTQAVVRWSPPPNGQRDDLILIRGVGPVLQRLLHRMGIYRFEQVMAWDEKDIAAVTARLPSFKGRIEREGWVQSARREYEKKYGRPGPDAHADAEHQASAH